MPVPPAAASGTGSAAQAAGKPVETFEQADAAIARATEAVGRAARLTPLAKTAANGAVALPRITENMPAGEAAALLAAQMRRIPGIERHLAIPLVELDQRGPRPVRAAWRLARERVAESYGGITVGELLARFGDAATRPGRRDDPSRPV